MKLSLGSKAPTGNEIEAFRAASGTSSSPPRPFLKSPSSAGANTLVEREHNSSHEVSLIVKQEEEGDDDLASLRTGDGYENPQMSGVIMISFDPEHESRNNTVGSHDDSPSTPSKRKRRSMLSSFKKQRTTEPVAGDDQVVPTEDIDMVDAPNRPENLAQVQARPPPLQTQS